VPPDAQPLTNSAFALKLHRGAVVSLARVGDAFDTEYIRPGSRLGDVLVRYRITGGDWREVNTTKLAEGAAADFAAGDATGCAASYPGGPFGAEELHVHVHLALEGEQFIWRIELVNRTDRAMEVGDLALPLPMNTKFVWDKAETTSRRVYRHSFIAGDGSFVFWMRPNSVGPYLLMLPADGTSLEYFDARGRGDPWEGAFCAYIHSTAQGAVARAKGCNWRQPHTRATLAPAGQKGDQRTYALRFLWVDDYDAVRDALYAAGKLDIHVVPGMTVPTDLSAMFSLRTQHAIGAIDAEHPEQTEIQYLPQRGRDVHVYEVKFARLGENLLTVRYGDGRRVGLEFFVTEPVETLIRKRSAFLIDTQQHRDPTKWYDGLISDWNMETQVLLGPENLDRIKGWRRYMVTCDDPGLCKAPYVASKNLEYPSQREIEALDYYISNFVWGGLQRTTAETYPYGIYGIQTWKENRESDDEGPKGKLHIWRIYDYPHMILLYLRMYQIARSYADIEMDLPPEEYLRRAFGTARAFFTIPWEVTEWSAYKTGTYNELVIPELIDELDAAGWSADAASLRDHWARKVEQFVGGEVNLFGSEFPFDSTGFESTHALAKYALERMTVSSADKEGAGAITRRGAEEFMELQTACNIFCRGWLEMSYYHYGSDYRSGGSSSYTLSYMAQMGGWSLMDYALYWSSDPVKYLPLAYASILSSWALMNTGTAESNYGYWYPGKANDGAAGGGFEPEPFGRTWLRQPHARGAWYYGCEIDLGFSGALRAAATVVAEDPIFGLIAFGGRLDPRDGALAVTPRDGVRRRLHVIRPPLRFHMLLDRDHYAAGKTVELAGDLSAIAFDLEPVGTAAHTTRLSLSGLPDGRYHVRLDDRPVAKFASTDGGEVNVELPVAAGAHNCRVTITAEPTGSATPEG